MLLCEKYAAYLGREHIFLKQTRVSVKLPVGRGNGAGQREGGTGGGSGRGPGQQPDPQARRLLASPLPARTQYWNQESEVRLIVVQQLS